MLEWKTEHPDQTWAASAVCLKRSPASPHPRHWPTSWCAGRSVRWLYRTPGRSPGGTEREGKTEAKQIRKSDQDGQNHWSLHHRNCFKAISVGGSGGLWSSERLCGAASSLQRYIVIPALVCSIVWWWSGISPGQPYPWKKTSTLLNLSLKCETQKVHFNLKRRRQFLIFSQHICVNHRSVSRGGFLFFCSLLT